MEKINFKNIGEPGAIPINADNLNLMQNNVENSFKSSRTTSDKDTYNCNYINNIVESGSNDNGTWIKYTDGTMITYQNVNITISVTEPWGGIFVGNYATPISFPQVFQEPPEVLIDLKFTQGAGWRVDWDFPVITNSSIKNIGVGRGTASDVSKFKATIFAIGKWK
jgi:hypothetical protein